MANATAPKTNGHIVNPAPVDPAAQLMAMLTSMQAEIAALKANPAPAATPVKAAPKVAPAPSKAAVTIQAQLDGVWCNQDANGKVYRSRQMLKFANGSRSIQLDLGDGIVANISVSRKF